MNATREGIAGVNARTSSHARDMRLYVDDRPEAGVFRVHPNVYADQALFDSPGS